MAKPLKITIIDRAAERSASAPEPTPERYARAGGDIRKGADGVRRVEEDPLDRLYTRGCLDRADKARNHVLYLAGQRYHRHWFMSGLSGVASIDLLQAGSGGASMPASSMPRSEAAAVHRSEFRLAQGALGEHFSEVVDKIVLERRDAAEISFELTRHRNVDRGRAVVIDRLSGGLAVLAKLWGMSANSGKPN